MDKRFNQRLSCVKEIDDTFPWKNKVWKHMETNEKNLLFVPI